MGGPSVDAGERGFQAVVEDIVALRAAHGTGTDDLIEGGAAAGATLLFGLGQERRLREEPREQRTDIGPEASEYAGIPEVLGAPGAQMQLRGLSVHDPFDVCRGLVSATVLAKHGMLPFPSHKTLLF